MHSKIFTKIVSVVMVLVMVFSVPTFAQDKSTAEQTNDLEKRENHVDSTLKPGEDYVEGEVIVVYDKNDDKEDVYDAIEDEGGEVKTSESLTEEQNILVAEIPRKESVEEAIEEIQKEDDVLYAQPNYIHKMDSVDTEHAVANPTNVKGAADLVNDSEIDKQYYLDTINVAEAWENIDSKPHEKIRVAVIDTGADINHEDLTNVINKDLSVKFNGTEIEPLEGDTQYHGSHISGTIAAQSNNGLGVAGVASGTKNDIVDLIAINGYNGVGFPTSTMVEAIKYCNEKGARIINMSYGWIDKDLVLEDTINDVFDKGTLCICAAGNDGSSAYYHPASFENVIGVINLLQNGVDKHKTSNYGSTKNKVSAPGTSLYNTIPINMGGPYVSMTGTSMATPVVVGVASMVLSLRPDLTPGGLAKCLKNSCVDIGAPGYDDLTGEGRIDAGLAVKNAVGRYTIKLHKDGECQTIEQNLWDEVSLEGKIKSGYTLDNWNTKPDGTGDKYYPHKSYCDIGKKDGEQVDLYAQWREGEEYNDGFVYYELKTTDTPNDTLIITNSPTDKDHIWYSYKNERLMFDGNKSNIKYVETKGNIRPMNTSLWFRNFENVEKIDFNSVDTSNVSDMKCMFYGCSKLTDLDVSQFNTSNVTDMGFMFAGCSSLRNLNVSGFNTSNVAAMDSMFEDCESLENLDISGFDTSNVYSIKNIFKGCSSVRHLDVDEFNTQNVNNMYAAFEGCSSLEELDISNFDTSNVIQAQCIFKDCSELTRLNIGNFDTSKMEHLDSMFAGCTGLTSIDVSEFDTSKAKSMSGMFEGCTSLTSIDVSGFETSGVTLMQSMFKGCSSLRSLDLSYFRTGSVHDMSEMFKGSSNLEMIYATDAFITTGLLLDWYGEPTGFGDNLFTGCTKLVGGNGTGYDSAHTDYEYARLDLDETQKGYFTKKDPRGTVYYKLETTDSANDTLVLTDDATVGNIWFDSMHGELKFSGDKGSIKYIETSGTNIKPTSTAGWFSGFRNVERINLSALDTSKVTNMADMFWNCEHLKNLNISNFKTSKVTNMGNMFSGCGELTSLDLSSFDTSQVAYMTYMFANCSNLTNLNLSKFNTSQVTYMGGLFQSCNKLTNLDLSNFDTSQVTNMANMFSGCSALTSLDLSNFDTSQVTNMGSMFQQCSGLTSLDLTSFDTSQVNDMQMMFMCSSNLHTLDLANFDTSQVTNMSMMFTGLSNLKSVYASDSFVTDKVTNDACMFSYCSELVGGNGTRYSDEHIGKEYARIDLDDTQKGYFTAKKMVTFDTQGGSDVSAQRVIPGNMADEPEAPTKTGYVFDNWYTEPGGGDAFDFENTSINTDVTLYAHWTANKYEVALNANGGSGGQVSAEAVYGKPLEKITTLPMKEGYSLAGWYSEVDEGIQVIDDEGNAVEGTEYVDNEGKWIKLANVTLYAHWTANKYTATLNTNGGQGGQTSAVVTYDEIFKQITMLPTKEGYGFEGWYTGAAAGTKIISADGNAVRGTEYVDASGKWIKAANVILYAHWTENNNYTVKYDSNGGSTISNKTGVKWTENKLLPTSKPKKSGCTFLGWYTAKTGGTQVKDSTKYSELAGGNEVSSVTVYAHYLMNATGFKIKSSTNKKATLTWKKGSGVTGYKIYVNGKYKFKAGANATSVTIELKPGSVYKFQISAYAKVGSTTYETSKSAVVTKITSPAKVSIKKATSKSKAITITWGKTTCTKYEVQLALDKKFKKGLKKAATKSAKTLNAKFSKLSQGKSYYVRVRAVLKSGKTVKYGAWSVIKCIKCK